MNLAQRSGQSGFGLLYALLIVLAVGTAVTIGILLLKAPVPAQQAWEQEQSLDWADQAVAAFAAAHSRLPCPAATMAGPEDCDNGHAKGWLPLQTLIGASGPDRGIGPLRYMVYRSPDAKTDLAQASNQYTPKDSNGDAREFADTHINGLDMCRVLANAAAAGPAATAARVTDASGALVNVAYGIAAAGPTPGSNGRFDGLNQDDAAMLEPPARGASADYDDRVRIRGFASLAQSLDCGFPSSWTTASADTVEGGPDSIAIAAMDSLSSAVAIADAAKDAQDDNKEGTKISLGFAISAEVFDGISVALAGVAMASSVTTLATASAALAGAIASCAATLGLSPTCALIPVYATAVAVAGTAVALAGTALGLSAAALAGTSAALGLTSTAYDKAHETPSSTTPIDLTSTVQTACDAADKLSGQADEDGKAAADAQTEKQTLAAELDRWKKNPSDYIDYDSYKRYDAQGNLTYSLSNEDKADLNAKLQAKLAAIYAEEQARQTLLQDQAQTDSAKHDVDNTQNSIDYLISDTIPKYCTTGSGSYNEGLCTGARQSLAALRDCDLDTDDDGQDDLDVVCLPQRKTIWQNLQAVTSQSAGTLADRTASEQALPAPAMRYDCSPKQNAGQYCSILIIDGQTEGDHRRTYARIVALYLQAVVNANQLETQAQQSRTAASDAQARCTDLRNLQQNGPQGAAYIERWDGASSIIEAADARGSVGQDQPR